MANCCFPWRTETHCRDWFFPCDAFIWINTREISGLEHYAYAADPIFLSAHFAWRISTRDPYSIGSHNHPLIIVSLFPGAQRSSIGKAWLHRPRTWISYRCNLHDRRFYCTLLRI